MPKALTQWATVLVLVSEMAITLHGRLARHFLEEWFGPETTAYILDDREQKEEPKSGL